MPRRLRRDLIILMLLCMSLPTLAVLAQGGGNVPSFNGGAYGGPGMVGATGNGSSIPATGLNDSALAGQSAAGRGNRGGTGTRPNLGQASSLLSSSGRPGALSGTFSTEGLAALFGGENGIASQINQTLQAGLTWQTFGGFGTGSADGTSTPAEAVAATTGALSNGLGSVAAAALGTDLSTAFAAQVEAINSGTEAAQSAAQAAYDQYWADYYATLDALAQQYFNMTLAEAEALYEQALTTSAAALDTFEQNAEYYATYCLYYPWDCYSYAYDAAVGAYENVEAVSDSPAATVILGEVESAPESLSDLASEVMLNSPEAFEVIMVFASDQLGLTVQPLYAGTLTEDIANYLLALPAPVATYASLLVDTTSFWGLWSDGVAGVAIADCGLDTVCNLDQIPLEMSDASAGIFMLDVATPPPASAEAALDLITTVFPKLNGLSFSQVADAGYGIAFLATAYGVGAENNGQPVTVAKLIFTGVNTVEGDTAVYALVAVGETQIQSFQAMFQ